MEQLTPYREFQAQIQPQTVYIICLGGWTEVPEHIYCLRLSEADYTGSSLTMYKGFEHRCGTPLMNAEWRLH
jgi:hypothetical protein